MIAPVRKGRVCVRVGCFIKTPSAHVAEVLGLSGLDFGVIDGEHGPLDRGAADQIMLGGRAGGLPMLIRIPDLGAPTVLWALDIGAAGLIAPHVDTAGQASELVANAKFADGVRGFSNAGRYARYGTTNVAEAMRLGDLAAIFCQIESGQAVANAVEIAATPGVSGIVVGRADLALSLGETTLDAPAVLQATRAALTAARAQGKEAVIVTSGVDDLRALIETGATMAIIGSDQSLMRAAAAKVARDAQGLFDAYRVG